MDESRQGKNERARRKFARDLVALIEEDWDRRGLSPMERAKLVRQFDAFVEKFMESRRGH